MLHLLDANVLIDAHRDYYSISRVSEFWDWLVDCGQNGLIKIPIEVYEEIRDGKVKEGVELDLLTKWAKESSVSDALLFQEDCRIDLVQRVLDEGYAADLTDSEVEQIGRDPFLVAYALVNPAERCIVTTEVSKPSKKRANRHLPDVCNQFGIKHCNTYEFVRTLDFNTKWNKR